MKRTRIKTINECAIMIALATILSLIVIYTMPLGGAVTLAGTVPILIISIRHGVKWGVGSGFVFSILQLILGIGNLTFLPTATGIILCTLLDYLFAFSILGICGVFRKISKNIIVSVAVGTLIACIFRFFFHYLSGAVVWYELTKVNNWNETVNRFGMWAYSAIYNLQYMIPETVIAMIVTPVAVKKILPLFDKKA